MPFRLRQIPENDKMCHHIALHTFQELYPLEQVAEILTQCRSWEKRERQLNMPSIVYLLMALSLFPRHDQAAVLQEIASGLRFLWPNPLIALPGNSAICYRRKQLGVTPMRHLMHHACRPLATAHTADAFALNRRIMAIDGTTQDVADTRANAMYFGRLTEGPSRSPFPQLRAVYLAECGTHAVIDAVLAPCKHNERTMASQLLRSIQADMLITMDRGFFSLGFVLALRQRGAEVLSRLQRGMLMTPPAPRQILPDGSWLVTVTNKTVRGLKQPVCLRVVQYQVNDPDVPHFQQTQRLVTTLLDPHVISAQELVDLYHQRWEIETTIDEHKTHQRLAQTPLRSHQPSGVYQEMYGLLLAHYAIRALMYQAATQAHLDPDRLSFTSAIQAIQRSVHEFALTDPQDHGKLRQRLLHDLRQRLLPARRLRFNARVVKRPLSSFRRKRSWHQSLHLKGLSFLQIFLI